MKIIVDDKKALETTKDVYMDVTYITAKTYKELKNLSEAELQAIIGSMMVVKKIALQMYNAEDNRFQFCDY